MSDKPSFVTAWTEPESAANTDYPPIYPYNNVIAHTKGGHSLEMDDTPTRERIRLQHRSNTFIEMHPNGDEVHKIFGDGYHIVLGDNNIQIGIDDGNKAKKLNITVYGDAYLNVKGDKIEEIDGNVEQHIKGNFSQTIEGLARITCLGDMSISAGASATGSLNIQAGDHVMMNSDVEVKGSITADQITSTGRVDAATGMSAGILGFVTLTGGVSAGLPIASPGSIMSSMDVISPLIIGSTMTYGSMLLDPMGGVPLVRSVFDSHIHIAPNGPTSTPIPMMPLP